MRTETASFSSYHHILCRTHFKIICAEEHEQEMLTIKFSLTAFYKRAEGLGTAVKVRKGERWIVCEREGENFSERRVVLLIL